MHGSVVSTSFSFDGTVTSLLSPLMDGLTIHLLPEEDSAFEKLFALIDRSDERLLFKLTPSHFRGLLPLLADRSAVGNHRHRLVMGGEALEGVSCRTLLNHYPNFELINHYGPSEATVGCLANPVVPDHLTNGTVPIGRPIANTRVYILDAQGLPLPIGVTGELHIGGTGVARGYLNQPELTAERFITCLLYTSPSPRDRQKSRMPSSA